MEVYIVSLHLYEVFWSNLNAKYFEFELFLSIFYYKYI